MRRPAMKQHVEEGANSRALPTGEPAAAWPWRSRGPSLTARCPPATWVANHRPRLRTKRICLASRPMQRATRRLVTLTRCCEIQSPPVGHLQVACRETPAAEPREDGFALDVAGEKGAIHRLGPACETPQTYAGREYGKRATPSVHLRAPVAAARILTRRLLTIAIRAMWTSVL